MTSAQGKTVLITGAAGGLGKEIAETFLAAGANVVICDINTSRLTTTNEEWSKSHPGKYLTHQTDVTSESAIQDLIDQTIAKFSRLDILINNAGIMDDFSSASTCPKPLWDRVLSINLTGPFLTTKAAITQFQKQNPSPGGVIINIASIGGVLGFQAGVAYTASKHALVGLTKNTAGFYGSKGISCIALLPGGFAGTNIADALQGGMNMEAFQALQEARPSKVSGSVKSIAKYCLYLADDNIAPGANGSCVVFSHNYPEA